MKLAAVLALACAVAAGLGGSSIASAQPAVRPARQCGDAGGLGFVCGLTNVEDLAPVPGTRFLVGSSFKEGSAGLYLIDTVARTGRPVRLSAASRRDPRYPGCAAPDLARLSTHGLAVAAGANGTATVYAVNHGGRESVEIFRLDAAAGAAAWIGCLILPAGANGNSVAALAGGRIAVSRFDDAGDAQGIVKILRGQITGLVYIWTPGKGFSVLPQSRLSGDNGLVASPDGRWLFVNDYGRNQVWRLPLSGSGKPLKASVAFHPDNLRWSPDGALLVTGQFVTADKLAGLHDWATVRLDPRTMAVTPVLKQRGLPEFDSATVAVQAGDMLWFGTFRGDRIAYRRVPHR